MRIAEWIEAGNDLVAVDAQGAVCGVLRWLDDKRVIRPPNGPQRGAQSVIREKEWKMRGFTAEEARIHREGLRRLFKPTGRELNS